MCTEGQVFLYKVDQKPVNCRALLSKGSGSQESISTLCKVGMFFQWDVARIECVNLNFQVLDRNCACFIYQCVRIEIKLRF